MKEALIRIPKIIKDYQSATVAVALVSLMRLTAAIQQTNCPAGGGVGYPTAVSFEILGEVNLLIFHFQYLDVLGRGTIRALITVVCKCIPLIFRQVGKRTHR